MGGGGGGRVVSHGSHAAFIHVISAYEGIGHSLFGSPAGAVPIYSPM